MPIVRPLKYSGKRADDYATIKILYADDKEARWNAISKLNKAETKARKIAEKRKQLKREAEFLRQQEEEFMKEIEKEKPKYARRKETKRGVKANVIVDITAGRLTEEQYEAVQQQIKTAVVKLIGQKQAYMQITNRTNGADIFSGLIDIKGNDGTAIFYNSIYQHLFTGGSEGTNIFMTMNVRFVILQQTIVPSERVQQMFRDGEVHCVIQPLFNLWSSMAKNSESPASAKRCMQIANRIKSLENDYPLGVPEDKMDEVAKISHRCIIIHDILGNEIFRYNKNSSKFFHFTNTRINHIDTGYITLDKQYESVSQEQIMEIYKSHNKNKEFYLFTGDMKNKVPQSIRSASGAWAVYNPDYELFNQFSKSVGVSNYGIDAVKHSSLNEFVKEARIINSAPTPLCSAPNDIEGASHLDVEKAYTQHSKSKYFKGFLGHIQQYRKLSNVDSKKFLETHVGIFQFKVVGGFNDLLSKLGICVGNTYTLPSPEIEYFMDRGLTVELLGGCWGSTFDIKYTDEMLTNRRYCTWAGKLGMDKEYDSYTFKGTSEWASHLKYILGDNNVFYFSDNSMIVVKVPKKSYFTTHHILAFITSYTRLNMFDVMEKIDGELIKVVLDGIYYRGIVGDISIPHKTNKDMIRHLGFRDAWYYPSNVDISDWTDYNPDLDGNCVLAGAGGTGKSFSVLTDSGIINPLYVVPSHLLGRKCREKYGVNYTTINKLIGADSVINGKAVKCRPYAEQYREPGVVFIDEMTMIESSWIQKAIDMHPNTLFFIAGDIDEKQWYQCRNGHPGAFSSIWIPSDWRFVYYKNDMRSKDQALKDMKIDIRQQMKEVFTNGGQEDANKIAKYVKSKYNTVKFDDAVKMFCSGDIWIAGTHKTNSKLLNAGVVSGYINKNKEIVSSEEVGSEKRGSFTTHSFQGLTIEDSRLFVSLDFFEYAMLYTSISRVCNFSQLVIVD